LRSEKLKKQRRPSNYGNIVLSDKEARGVGESRWAEKNGKKYLISYAIAGIYFIIGMIAVYRYPTNLLPIIVVGAAMFVSVYIYTRNEITKPKKQAGIDFLKEYRS
jgi:hypothetical protein